MQAELPSAACSVQQKIAARTAAASAAATSAAAATILTTHFVLTSHYHRPRADRHSLIRVCDVDAGISPGQAILPPHPSILQTPTPYHRAHRQHQRQQQQADNEQQSHRNGSNSELKRDKIGIGIGIEHRVLGFKKVHWLCRSNKYT